MQKVTLLLFIFLPLLSLAQTYSYKPMNLDVGTHWRIKTVRQTTSSSPPAYCNEYALVEKDTLIYGLNYKKIVRHSLEIAGASCFPYDKEYLVREDSSKKVLLFLPAFNRDTVLLDFNISLGDSVIEKSPYFIPVTFSSLNPYFNSIIDSIAIVNYNGIDRRVFYSSWTGYPIFIEGVGTNFGFPFWNMEPFLNTDLLCMGDVLDRTLYPDTTLMPQNACPRVLTLASTMPQKLEGVKIYPSIVNNSFWIKNEQEKQLEYSLFSPIGKLLRKGVAASYHNELNLSNLSQGFYFIRISENTSSTTYKIFKD